MLCLGTEPVAHALAAMAGLREDALGVRVVTNNASRSPDEVVAMLAAAGFDLGVHEIVTSAAAAAALAAAQVPPATECLVVGSTDLAAQVAVAGLVPVRRAGPLVGAVVQGLDADVGWRDLAEAALAIQAGAVWVAANTDTTYPTARGLLPGCGALVAALTVTTGRTPLLAGKPEPTLLRTAQRHARAAAPLMVGDRLDTDIRAAGRAGLPSLLVLTGVSTVQDALDAAPADRPTVVGADLRALAVLRAHSHLLDPTAPLPVTVGERAGTWTARGTTSGADGVLASGGSLAEVGAAWLAAADADPLLTTALLTALARAAWSLVGDQGPPG